MTPSTHARRDGRTRRLGRIGAMVVVFGAIVVAARRCRAQESASRAGVLLTLPTSTRALGLGDASGAAAPDAWATFTAPSQLALLRAPSAALSTEAYLASTRLSAIAAALPVGRGTLGIGATMLDYGTIDEIATSVPGTDGTETGRTVSAQDVAVVIAWAAPISRGMRAGAALEFVSSRVADLSGSGVAASAGVGWTAASGWDVEGALQHAGGDVAIGATRGSLPLTVRLAVAAPSRRYGKVAIRPLLEVRHVRGAGTAVAGAAEAAWTGVRGIGLSARAGYSARGAGDGRWPVSLGAGARLGSFTLDYAMERFPALDQVTHRVGLRIARPAER